MLRFPSRANTALSAFPACALLVSAAVSASAQVGVYTRSYDNSRTGNNTHETILTPATVSSANFQKLFTVHMDGQVYAQPLYVPGLTVAGAKHNVVILATMLNSVYALDADTGASLWTLNVGTPINPQKLRTTRTSPGTRV